MKKLEYRKGQQLLTTKKLFVNKAQEIHGNKFNYNKVKYVNSRTKIIIICPIHGEIFIRPDNHLKSKTGCSECGKDTRIKTKSGSKNKPNKYRFEQKANLLHNNKYNYSKSNYINAVLDIIITCPIHGDFSVKPSLHIRGKGQGCPECSNKERRGWTKTGWCNLQKDRLSKLYVVKYKSDNNEFIKIGITHQELKVRMLAQLKALSIFDTYEAEIIKVIESLSAERIFDKELKIKRDLRNYIYNFQKRFDGSTECYQLAPKVLEYINNL